MADAAHKERQAAIGRYLKAVSALRYHRTLAGGQADENSGRTFVAALGGAAATALAIRAQQSECQPLDQSDVRCV